jgi:hypothetical protein
MSDTRPVPEGDNRDALLEEFEASVSDPEDFPPLDNPADVVNEPAPTPEPEPEVPAPMPEPEVPAYTIHNAYEDLQWVWKRDRNGMSRHGMIRFQRAMEYLAERGIEDLF